MKHSRMRAGSRTSHPCLPAENVTILTFTKYSSSLLNNQIAFFYCYNWSDSSLVNVRGPDFLEQSLCTNGIWRLKSQRLENVVILLRKLRFIRSNICKHLEVDTLGRWTCFPFLPIELRASEQRAAPHYLDPLFAAGISNNNYSELDSHLLACIPAFFHSIESFLYKSIAVLLSGTESMLSSIYVGR